MYVIRVTHVNSHVRAKHHPIVEFVSRDVCTFECLNVQNSTCECGEHPYIYCDGVKVVFRGEGCVCMPVGAAGECMVRSSGGRLDRRFLPLSLLCSTSP